MIIIFEYKCLHLQWLKAFRKITQKIPQFNTKIKNLTFLTTQIIRSLITTNSMMRSLEFVFVFVMLYKAGITIKLAYYCKSGLKCL